MNKVINGSGNEKFKFIAFFYSDMHYLISIASLFCLSKMDYIVNSFGDCPLRIFKTRTF